MGQESKRLIYWTPRLMGVLFTIFIGLFALDVFGEGYRLGGLLIALFMHLIPTYMIAFVLLIAWRREGIGGLLFLLLGLLYFLFFHNQPNRTTYLFLTGLPILIGALFILATFYHVQEHVRVEQLSE